VGIPLAIALFTSFVVAGRILMTSAYLIKNKMELLKNLSPALMILLFYLLFKHVKVILGVIQAYITIVLIGFFGLYFLTKK